MPLGKPLPQTTAEPPTKDEIDRIVRNWNQAHPKYKGLLEAKPYELGEDSDWYWSQTDRQYINKNDVKVKDSLVAGLLLSLLVGRKLSDAKTAGLMGYSQLSEGLKSGSLSIADWQAGMRELIKINQSTSLLLANGGSEFVTQSDYSYLVDRINKQFAYLDGFAKDIANNPEKWMSGRLDNRMRLYQESAYSAYENARRREATLGGMDEERRLLGVADHCGDCLEAAALGWQPIGTLPEIGDSVCTTNCHCEFEYRKAGENDTD